MSKKRLVQILFVTSLIALLVLVTQEGLAAGNRMSQGSSIKGTKISACASLPSRHSIHTEYEPERGMWVTYTEDGPAGLDGGLIELVSNYRTCSK